MMAGDIAMDRLRENLLQLKMFTAESIVDSVLEQAVSKEMPAVEVLDAQTRIFIRSSHQSSRYANREQFLVH